jgi:hypothetical protein
MAGVSADTGLGRSGTVSCTTHASFATKAHRQPLESIAPKVRQSTLRERAAKHAATEVLEGIELEAGRQSG